MNPTLVFITAYPADDLTGKCEAVLIFAIFFHNALFLAPLFDEGICPFIGFTADNWLMMFGNKICFDLTVITMPAKCIVCICLLK